MDGVQPWMRLKVKADTFCLPDDDGSVYFRNNTGSFRMEGTAIQSWIEKLLSVFDGQQTLESLTEGLPAPYQDRIYQIADILLTNGYVRDVSTDEAHQLSAKVLEDFRPQIDFVDNLVGSGASRFQTYRNAKILAIGTGAMLVSLVSSLWESGVSSVNLLTTDPGAETTSMERLKDFMAWFDSPELRVEVNDISNRIHRHDGWREAIRDMDAVLYVSESGDIEELRHIESICSKENRLFVPAICIDGFGVVGPTLGGDSAFTWDAAWRCIHQSVFESDIRGEFASTSGAVLANVLVFELFKVMTGLNQALGAPQLYILNLATLQGKWHPLIRGQSETDGGEIREMVDVYERLSVPSNPSTMSDLLSWLAHITDSTSGVFHVWDEGNLPQLPLAQCRVQPIHPLSQGPAELLAETVCTGFTHEEARLEAGFTGIEQYVRQFAIGFTNGDPFLGIGTGATMDEAVWRGLHQCLVERLRQDVQRSETVIRLVNLTEVHDEKCNYYLQALRSFGVDPVVGLGTNILGLPVVWVGVNGNFVGSVGLGLGMALQKTLEYVLHREVCVHEDCAEMDARWVAKVSDYVVSEYAPESMEVEAWHGFDAKHSPLTSALEVLQRNGHEITVLDFAVEPFLQEMLAGVFGVSIRQGGV